MKDQYDSKNVASIPVVKTMDYENTSNIVDYEEYFNNMNCVKEILIPNIQYNCDCISAMRNSNERFIKAKLIEERDSYYIISIYDWERDRISFFEVSKKYFDIDEMDFLNHKKTQPKDRYYNRHWVI